MKRIVSFLLTLSLLLSIAPLTFATETELTEVTSLPVALTYDSDLIVTAGDTLNPDTFMGGEAVRNYINDSYPLGPTLSTTTYDVYVDAEKTTVENRPAVVTKVANANFGAFAASNVESTINGLAALTNIGVSFDFADNAERGGVNDTIIRYGTQEAITVKASGRPSNKIYFAHRANGKVGLSITLEYTDGTKSEAKTLSSQVYDNFKASGITNYITKKYFNFVPYKMNAEGKAEAIKVYTTEKKYLASDGTTQKSVAIPDGKGDYKTKNYDGTCNFVGVSYIEVDAGKVVKNIIIGSPSAALIAIYAATEGLLTNADLQAAIPATVTEETTNDTLIYAKACADELNKYRNDTTNYSYITTEYNKRGLMAKEVTSLPIALPYDSDTIVKAGDTLDPKTFMGGETAWDYIKGTKTHQPTTNKAYNVITAETTNDNGTPDDASDDTVEYTTEERYTVTYPASTYFGAFAASNVESNLNAVAALTKLGVTFDFPADAERGGVVDSIVRYGNQNAVKVSTSGRPQNKIYFAHKAEGSRNVPITLEYTDGTSETITMKSQAYDNFKSSSVNNYVGKLYINYNVYTINDESKAEQIKTYSTEKKYYLTAEGTKSTSTASVTIPNGDGGWKTKVADSTAAFIGVSYVPVAEGKIVKNISIGKVNDGIMAIFGATEGFLSNSELNDVVSADLSGASAKEIEYAKACADELILRGADPASYESVYDAYTEVQLSKAVYIDIPVNTDVIVAEGDTVAADAFSGRNENKSLYDAADIPENGIIAMNARSSKVSTKTKTEEVDGVTKTTITNTDAAYYGDSLEDAIFQLSGAYKGIGNDAVLVAGDGGDVTIELPEEQQGVYKDFYFLLDSPNGNQTTPTTVNVRIEYEDGTYLEAKTNTFYSFAYCQFSDGYTLGSFYANKSLSTSAFDMIESEGVLTATASKIAKDGTRLYASSLNPTRTVKDGVEITVTDEATNTTTTNHLGANYNFKYPKISYKNVKSITFMPIVPSESWSGSADYTILGITAVPYTKEDLLGMWDTALEYYDDDPENIVVGENDIAIEEGAKAVIELYDGRGLEDYGEDADYAVEILAEIYKARQLHDSNFETVLDFDFDKENDKVKATATISNFESDGKEVILIVAVYGEDNKLLDIATSAQKRYELGAENRLLETEFCDAHKGEAVSYAAFIWDSLDSLRGISYTTKDAKDAE